MTSYIYDMVDTWNAGATTFTAVKMNVTDTASAASSLLMDLQVGGSSRFSVNKSGYVKATNRVTINSGASETGIQVDGGDALLLKANGAFCAKVSSAGLNIPSTGSFSIANSTSATDLIDLFLTRRAAANLRLGAADAATAVAQTLSVQSVVAGTTNTAGANLTITGSQGTGTGAGGSIVFQVAPAGSSGTAQNALATALTIASDRSVTLAGTLTVSNNASLAGQYLNLRGGNFYFEAPSSGVLNLFNGGFGAQVTIAIDAANALALRNGANAQTFNIYNTYTDAANYARARITFSSGNLLLGTEKAGTGFAGSLEFQTDGVTRLQINTFGISLTSGGVVGWTSRSVITSPSDGVLKLRNAADNGFTLLQFGGSDNSAPALKRSSTTLQARLADDSAFASVQGKLTTETAYTAGDPTTTGYLVVYDSTGTAYKIPAVLN